MARVKTQLKMKWQADMLRQMASIDVLTEIPNRQKFEEVFDREWKMGVRNKAQISVAFIDIDFFKQYNDAYGHGRGDQCLKEVAQALVDSVHRPGDFVARYGGEEFIAVSLKPHARRHDNCRNHAQKCRAAQDSPCAISFS